MAQQLVELTCPGCGARVTTGQKECEWCHGPVVITTFNTIEELSPADASKYARMLQKTLDDNPDHAELNSTVGFCHLKRKMYDKALACFERALDVEFNNSELYFYAAVCMLGGKKPFLHTKPIIDKIEEYIDVAIEIEPRGIYLYFLAYIKKDYYARKYLKTSPSWEETLDEAYDLDFSDYDVDQLFAIAGLENTLEG